MTTVDANVCLACGWRNDTDPDPDRDTCPNCEATFNNAYVERLFTKQLATDDASSTSFQAPDDVSEIDFDDMDTVDAADDDVFDHVDSGP